MADQAEPLISSSGATTGGLVDPETLLQSDTTLTAELVHQCLLPLSDSAALELCHNLLISGRVDHPVLAQQIIELGQARGESSVRKVNERVRQDLNLIQDESLDWSSELARTTLTRVLENETSENTSAIGYGHLVDMRQRLATFEILAPPRSKSYAQAKPKNQGGDVGALTDVMDLDDPWAEADTDQSEGEVTKSADGAAERIAEQSLEVDDPWESGSTHSAHSTVSRASDRETTAPTAIDEDLPFTLGNFLSMSLVESAQSLASSCDLSHLSTLWKRHGFALWPWRYAILDALPPWFNPLDMDDSSLLPRVGRDGAEDGRPDSKAVSLDEALAYQAASKKAMADQTQPRYDPLLNEELTSWYVEKVESLDTYGLIDLQLAWVQQGASMGLSDLDALGEDLSLLSKLVYDADLSPDAESNWTLSSWRETSERDVIRAYLSNSTSDNIVSHIRRLVLPYLYVLESRAERSGQPDPHLVERSFHDALLDLPLKLALPIFEASKATVPSSERLIKNDLTVARLALACLYGSDQKDAWSIMSSIFECLPVWDISSSERDTESDQELTSTTLDSIASFVRPKKAGDPSPKAKDLFIFFSPLPFAALSRALDILDVHLESGEILARWDTPVQLRYLLQSAGHHQDQIDLAERMIRRQSDRGAQTDSKWTSLWTDMLKLNGGEDSSLRGAFGRLNTQEMMKIYLGGVLSSGKFDTARRMIKQLQNEHKLSDDTVEQVVLATSRDFYDNAENGNIHTGAMKLAYDCLSVPASSPAIAAQRDFIEATSRLSTFGIPSTSGSGVITPIEIRHAKSKLDLVRRVLQTSPDAFQHPDLILDLSDKLGYRNDNQARIQVLGMLVESAVKAGDFDAAFKQCQDMVTLSKKRPRAAKPTGDGEVSNSETITDHLWKSCLLVGSQTDFAEIDKRMILLGQAIDSCPAEEIPGILQIWRKVESGQIKLDEAAKRRRIAGIRSATVFDSKTSQNGSLATSPVVGEARVLGSRTAARAAKLAMNFGERLRHAGVSGVSPTMTHGLGIGRTASPTVSSSGEGRRSNDSDRPSIGSMLDGSGLAVAQGAAEAERVRQQARRALVRGVGWLLGADEKELGAGE
ncbi:secretory pathway protein Sec39-domain-containing protein [Kockovaella imperatae]|uniref:Secretory pathway protein Sec39-domain-containing protein n=1 Tax=Kockovaella imperatae TaxID=4999 RepID=A0A1Y1UFU8_9TREE|nr:secretory pathway protein Sec39-domain-containing protein [Kockovaella imperatae]ORX36407.1 secretory pathway protein Sec39-domain-containing protein [Kockovaella imperatae]